MAGSAIRCRWRGWPRKRGGGVPTMIALSPMHALFTARPEQYGPYSPSSRLFLNPLLATPELVFGDGAVRDAVARTGLAAAFARLERLELIDWPAAAQARLGLLRALFAQFFLAQDGPSSCGRRSRASRRRAAHCWLGMPALRPCNRTRCRAMRGGGLAGLAGDLRDPESSGGRRPSCNRTGATSGSTCSCSSWPSGRWRPRRPGRGRPAWGWD